MNIVPVAPIFPGVRPPSSDFQGVRDNRRGLAIECLIDLSVARSIAARTHEVIALAGNSIYSDPLIDASGTPIGGVIVAHFQDVNLNPQGARFTIRPPFIGRIPFTQILIENPAQAGKFARLLYGVDLEFSPGINANVEITGTVSTKDVPDAPGSSFQSTTAINSANEQIWAPASNLNGAEICSIHSAIGAGAGGGIENVLAKSSAPASLNDGDYKGILNIPANTTLTLNLLNREGVGLGKGLYRRSNYAEAAAFFGCNFTLR